MNTADNTSLQHLIQQSTGATSMERGQRIQSLWSGYGEVVRYQLQGCAMPSVIIKHIQFPEQQQHPRGWNTDLSHARKVQSYAVETAWYQQYSAQCSALCRVPKCYAATQLGDEHMLILEDLDAAGFALRKSTLQKSTCKLVLTWLAHFHAQFMSVSPENLWQEGSYWHLNTRPDELQAMPTGALRDAAPQIAQALQQTRFPTLIHGDAKVANFCFSADEQQVAAVDFQYVGGGCGMKDVAYFLGSCLHDKQLHAWQDELLDVYFYHLKNAVPNHINTLSLEQEWRYLYPMAWADFYRFLTGWMPEHQKINAYGQKMSQQALLSLTQQDMHP
ncbi:MAG: phosphotransferase [Mariprofundaceae bacterium]|nr:phosphotransferase [Mariprofundaceae bacterium]